MGIAPELEDELEEMEMLAKVLAAEKRDLQAENKRIVAESKQCHEQNDRLVSERLKLRAENERLKINIQYTQRLIERNENMVGNRLRNHLLDALAGRHGNLEEKGDDNNR